MASKTVIVTGANRGIGRAICELILLQSKSSPIVLFATSRKGEDLGFAKDSNQTVLYHTLDISKPDSIATLLQTVQKSKHTPLSVLINNAGVNLDDNFGPENAKRTLDVNYRGTLNICQAVLPLLSDDGRIVNLSSVGSSLKPYDPQLAQQIRSISSLGELEDLVREYEQAVADGREGQVGFPDGKAYSVSKACVNSFTGILARQNKGVSVNCCCPGWVNTDMGSMVGRAPKKPVDGARIPVRLGFGDIGGVSGRYWANDGITETGEGKVQEW